MIKYPKTPRYNGSLPIKLSNEIIVEEKLDGSNVAISFDESGMILQSRGHVLRGGPREKMFDFFKLWANDNNKELKDRLGTIYILYCEYLYPKHRVFYDKLPGYLCGLDIYDKDHNAFVNMKDKSLLMQGLVFQPPVLYQGSYRNLGDINNLIGKSAFKSNDWRSKLDYNGWKGTEDSDLMEGVYIRAESKNKFYIRPDEIIRAKYPRPEFEKIRDEDDDWMKRSITKNLLDDKTNFLIVKN